MLITPHNYGIVSKLNFFNSSETQKALAVDLSKSLKAIFSFEYNSKTPYLEFLDPIRIEEFI